MASETVRTLLRTLYEAVPLACPLHSATASPQMCLQPLEIESGNSEHGHHIAYAAIQGSDV